MLGMDTSPPPINVRFSSEQLALLRAQATAEDRPLSVMVRVLTMRGLAPAEPVRPAYTPVELRDPLAIGITAIVPNRAIDGSRQVTPNFKKSAREDKAR